MERTRLNGLFFIRLVLCLFLTGATCALAQEMSYGQQVGSQQELARGQGPTIFSTSGSSLSMLDKTPLEGLGGGPESWTSPEGLSSSLQVLLLLTVLSLAPAVLPVSYTHLTLPTKA